MFVPCSNVYHVGNGERIYDILCHVILFVRQGHQLRPVHTERLQKQT